MFRTDSCCHRDGLERIGRVWERKHQNYPRVGKRSHRYDFQHDGESDSNFYNYLVLDILRYVFMNNTALEIVNNLVFNSAIVIFAAAALSATSPSIPIFLTGEEVLFKLQTASHTLDKLGSQTRIAIRCRKYLTKLIEMASTTGTIHWKCLNNYMWLTKLISYDSTFDIFVRPVTS